MKRTGPGCLKEHPGSESSFRAAFKFHERKIMEREKLEMNLCPKGLRIHHGEFDPGSERTLAARLKHASRAGTGSLLPARAADW